MSSTSFRKEVFRLGSSSGARLSHVRSRDVDVTQINEIAVVVANGKGISVFDKEGIMRSPMSGWVWRFPSNTIPPAGLKLVNQAASLLHCTLAQHAYR